MTPHIESEMSINQQLGIAYARAGYQFQEALDDRRQRLAAGESPTAILAALRQNAQPE
jgi:hypothetical protein